VREHRSRFESGDAVAALHIRTRRHGVAELNLWLQEKVADEARNAG
jgi:hypothetical protein